MGRCWCEVQSCTCRMGLCRRQVCDGHTRTCEGQHRSVRELRKTQQCTTTCSLWLHSSTQPRPGHWWSNATLIREALSDFSTTLEEDQQLAIRTDISSNILNAARVRVEERLALLGE